MFEVEFYEDERGSSPAYDFVMSLENRKLQAKEDTQDPPAREIALAKRRRKDYLERKGKHNG